MFSEEREVFPEHSRCFLQSPVYHPASSLWSSSWWMLKSFCCLSSEIRLQNFPKESLGQGGGGPWEAQQQPYIMHRSPRLCCRSYESLQWMMICSTKNWRVGAWRIYRKTRVDSKTEQDKKRHRHRHRQRDSSMGAVEVAAGAGGTLSWKSRDPSWWNSAVQLSSSLSSSAKELTSTIASKMDQVLTTFFLCLFSVIAIQILQQKKTNNPFEMGVEQTQEIIIRSCSSTIIIIKRMRKKIEQSLFAENT